MNRLMSRSLVVLAFFAVSAFGAREGRAAESRSLFDVTAPQSSISYTITHKLHTVMGVSKKIEGKVAVLPDGTVQVIIRAPVASFDSQNSGRDEHMQETMEAPKYPFVAFKGVSKMAMPTAFPAKTTLNVQGELDFHGRKRMETIPVEVSFTSAGEAHASAKFDVSLDKYEVERPSLMLMKINDACQINMDLALKRS